MKKNLLEHKIFQIRHANSASTSEKWKRREKK